jgi:hypothetical protein
MVETPLSGDPVIVTVQRELSEELGVHLNTTELAERVSLLGFAVDLVRLRPEVCLRIDIASTELHAPAPTVAAEEFTAARFVPLSRSGLTQVWSTYSPLELTPAAAGAIALLEHAEAFGYTATNPVLP